MNNPYTAPGADLPDTYSDEAYQPQIFAMNGRIGRLRYLGYYSLIAFILMMVAGVVFAISGIALAASGGKGVGFLILVGILVYVPFIAAHFIMMKRRLNDLNQSGWLGLISLVPFVNIFFSIYIFFWPGTDSANDYGPKPVKNPPFMILIVLVPISIFVLGILAAIAIPAYQDYTKRAHQLNVQPAAQPDQGSQSSQ